MAAARWYELHALIRDLELRADSGSPEVRYRLAEARLELLDVSRAIARETDR